MQNRLSTAEIVIVIAGAVTLLGSFLEWIDFGDFGGGGESAWGDGLFPTYTFVGIFGTVMALQIVLSKLANVQFPDRVMGFTWPQIHLVLGFFAALIAISFLIVDKSSGDTGIGFILSLIAAIGLMVGAVMMQNERRGTTSPPPASGI